MQWNCGYRVRKSQMDHVLFPVRRLKVMPPQLLEDIVLPHEIPKGVIGKQELSDWEDSRLFEKKVEF